MNSESLRARLKVIAKDSNRTFMELFQKLTFERFLARVGNSKARENLIFKGGLCLQQYVETGRETKDIDFLLKDIEGNSENVEKIFQQVCGVDLEDFFEFSRSSVAKLEVGHKQYPGYRIKIDVSFGKMKNRLQIDIGIGDVVDEFKIELGVLEYKGRPLLGGSVEILAYPPVFIFSEKLQAIIELKTLNSRMKDYFDCYMLINNNILDYEKTKRAIEETFSRRKTNFQPIDDFSEQLGPSWTQFYNKVNQGPKEIGQVIYEINKFLKNLSQH